MLTIKKRDLQNVCDSHKSKSISFRVMSCESCAVTISSEYLLCSERCAASVLLCRDVPCCCERSILLRCVPLHVICDLAQVASCPAITTPSIPTSYQRQTCLCKIISKLYLEYYVLNKKKVKQPQTIRI